MSDKPAKEEKAEQTIEKAAPKEAAGAEKKIRKVSRMSLAEVESTLKSVKEKMGDFHSSFARHLLARRSELSENLLRQDVKSK